MLSYLCYYSSCFILFDDFILLIFNLAMCIFGLDKNKFMRTFDALLGFRPFQVCDFQVTLSKTSFASVFVSGTEDNHTQLSGDVL